MPDIHNVCANVGGYIKTVHNCVYSASTTSLSSRRCQLYSELSIIWLNKGTHLNQKANIFLNWLLYFISYIPFTGSLPAAYKVWTYHLFAFLFWYFLFSCAATQHVIMYFFFFFLFFPSVLTKLNSNKVDLTKPYACPKPNH